MFCLVVVGFVFVCCVKSTLCNTEEISVRLKPVLYRRTSGSGLLSRSRWFFKRYARSRFLTQSGHVFKDDGSSAMVNVAE